MPKILQCSVVKFDHLDEQANAFLAGAENSAELSAARKRRLFINKVVDDIRNSFKGVKVIQFSDGIGVRIPVEEHDATMAFIHALAPGSVTDRGQLEVDDEGHALQSQLAAT